jgi:hypothetical protein
MMKVQEKISTTTHSQIMAANLIFIVKRKKPIDPSRIPDAPNSKVCKKFK